MPLLLLERKKIWSINGNTGVVPGGSHQWFNLASGSGFTSDATNIPVGAWKKIGLGAADGLGTDVLLVQGSFFVNSVTAGDRLVTSDLLRGLAVGQFFDQEAGDTAAEQNALNGPMITRATAAPTLGNTGLLLDVLTYYGGTTASALLHEATLAGSISDNGIWLPNSAIPAANDAILWGFNVTHRAAGQTVAPTTQAVIPSPLRVSGLQSAWISLKHIVTYSGGTADLNINMTGGIWIGRYREVSAGEQFSRRQPVQR